MRKKSFFLIGMTSILLAFAMIGCDNGTSNGGGNTPTYPYSPTPQPGATVSSEDQLRIAISTGQKGVYRIVSSFGLTDDLIVNDGQHIVVGGGGTPDNITSFSAGETSPLFNATYTSNYFNIGAKLTLKSGASLTIARGAAVNATSGGELYVSSGAAVGVGVDVSGGNAGNIGASDLSSLHAEGGGSLYFETEATLAVTNDPTASKVKLETAASAITMESGANLAIAGTGTDAAKVIGGSGGDVVIEIPAAAPAAIGEVEVTVEGPSAEAVAIKNAVADKIENAVKGSPSKTTETATEINGLFNPEDAGVTAATEVTYTGTGQLDDITIPTGKKLIIKGAVTGQTAEIGGPGTLEITGSVTTAGTGITQDILASLVKATGGGKVVLSGTNSVAVSGPLEVNLTLEIEAGATLALGATGNIDILDENENITGTIINKGTISTAQNINAANGFGEFLALVGGTFEVKGTGKVTVGAGTTLVIPTGTTLKLSDTASVTGAANAKIVVQGSGEITGAENFYYSDGETAIIGAITTAGGTYTWDGSIDGNEGGWESERDASSASITANTPAEVKWEGNTVTVNYMGTDALGDVEIPAGKTLIIDSAVTTTGTPTAITLLPATTESGLAGGALIINAGKSIDLGTGGTITITDGDVDGIVTNNGTIKTAADISLVTATGTGTIVITGNSATSDATITLTQHLTIAESGKLTVTVTDAAFSGSGKTVTINASGELALGANVTGLGDATISNSGTITTAVTGAGSGTTLKAILDNAKGNITATGQVSVADEEELDIDDETTLTITGKLTVATGSPAGKVTVKTGGTLVSASGSQGELNGELEVEAGGTYKDLNSGGGTLWNGAGTATGAVTWTAGAKGYVGGEAAVNLRIGGSGDPETTTLVQLVSGTLKNTKGGYELAGNATVRGNFGLTGDDVFHIASGTLTVDLKWAGAGRPGGLSIDGVFILGQSSITGAGSASIVVTTPAAEGITGGLIYIDNAAGKNFYDNGGTKLVDNASTVFGTATDDTIVPEGTYNWDTNADGSSNAGWKASS
jgi:hypothetical protein